MRAKVDRVVGLQAAWRRGEGAKKISSSFRLILCLLKISAQPETIKQAIDRLILSKATKKEEGVEIALNPLT